MSIDYEKVEGFKNLEPKEAKAALAAYALDEFGVKLNRQKSFENMLIDLDGAVAVEPTKEKQEYMQFADEIVSVDEKTVVAKINGEEKSFDSGSTLVVVPAPEEKIEMEYTKFPDIEKIEEPVLKAPVSDSESISEYPVWLDGFVPIVYLMGRNNGSNGYYTCPWWIYDWIKQNPDWYINPDRCPHASAIPTLKSLAFYGFRDGSVTVRETRNSRFDTFKISLK